MNFIITGMFRSGTTYLSRALNANMNIACASDPIFPIFKVLRNFIEKRPVKDGAPFKNYSNYDEYLLNKNMTDAFDLHTELTAYQLQYVKQEIKAHSAAFSQKFSAISEQKLTSKSFFGLINQAFSIIKQEYGDDATLAIGFKEVWVDQFMQKMLKDKVCQKVIHLIRDPRAVAASNYVSGNCYPNLFLARQWRKSAQIAIEGIREDNDNYMVIRYEDLIVDREKTLSEICNFLSVPFDTAMLNYEKIKDGGGSTWKQNSSFSSDKMGSLNRWKEAIPMGHEKVIEFICADEMASFEYFCEDKKNDLEIADFDNLPKKSIAKWIQPYCNYDYQKELAYEKERQNLLQESRIK